MEAIIAKELRFFKSFKLAGLLHYGFSSGTCGSGSLAEQPMRSQLGKMPLCPKLRQGVQDHRDLRCSALSFGRCGQWRPGAGKRQLPGMARDAHPLSGCLSAAAQLRIRAACHGIAPAAKSRLAEPVNARYTD